MKDDWNLFLRLVPDDSADRHTWEYRNASGCRADVSLPVDTLHFDFPPNDNEKKQERTERVFQAMLKQYSREHEPEIKPGALLKINDNSVNLEVIKKQFNDGRG